MRNPFSFMQDRRRARRQSELPPSVLDAPRPKRSIRDAITDTFGKDAYDKVLDSSTTMAILLGGKTVYAGTVSKAVVARRRAANKRARIARQAHRRAAR